MTIVIPGGTGQIGRILARHFHGQGHTVKAIARHPAPAPWQTFVWNGRDLGPWARELDGADLVINLAGRSVNCRYTRANRRAILMSRVEATRAVGQAIAAASTPPPLWMNASTATIYRHAFDRPMDEATGEPGGAERDAPAAWKFSIDVATAWEKTFFHAPTPGTRTLALRSAMTMSPDPGGVFSVLRALARAGLGGPAGSGLQFVSWIHETDFIRALEFLIERPQFEGCVNVCSPNPLPNREFMADLRRACGVGFGLPAAKWMLEVATFVHRTESELLLKSRRVVPQRLRAAGFEFIFPDWPSAARELVSRC